MKVCYLSHSFSKGGAAIAAKRLLDKLTTNYQIETTPFSNKNLFTHVSLINKLPNLLFKKKGFLWSNSIWGQIKSSELKKFDLAHLHWVNNGLITIDELLALNIPIIWTLHDIWPLTGGCHTQAFCPEIKNSCYDCPITKNKFLYNLAYYNKIQKDLLLKKENINITVPSSWMREKVLSSINLPPEKVHLIPNGVDVDVFKSTPKTKNEFFKILWGGFSAFNDKNKNFQAFLKILDNLNIPKSKVEVNLIGSNEENKELIKRGIKQKIWPHISNELEMAKIYSQMDVTCVTSTFESFGQVALESTLCGTPVVAFDTSGLRDILVNNENGFLVQRDNISDYRDAIVKIHENKFKMNRQHLVENFDIKITAKKFQELYQCLV